MTLTHAEMKDEKVFLCPWHRAGGGRCGQSLAGASVIVNPGSRQFVPVAELVDKADAGESQIFWCPKCDGAVVVSPVEQGFFVGIPT